MLGKLPVPGRPTILNTVGQGPTVLAVGAGGGCLDIFTFIYPVSSLSPSLWETARYRLKYCLKGPLNPKQPTNQVLIAMLYSGHICLFEDSNSWRWVIVKQYINIMINDRGCTVITINMRTEILEQTVLAQIRLLLRSSLIRVCTVVVPPGIS